MFLKLILATTLTASAETPEEIIDRARQAQSIDNAVQQIRMVMVSRSGSERTRELEMRTRRDGDVVSSYARFSHPADVAGTQLVMVDHPNQVDEQMLYLPALQRVHRIAGKARSGAFMGSDFSYEDLEVSSAASATHTLLSEDDTLWTIETIPGADSSYSRIVSHVSKSDFIPRKIEYFDQRGDPFKLLEVLSVADDNGSTIPTRSQMRNLKKGTSTILEIQEYRLNVPLDEIPEETFTAAFMERNG